MAERFEKDQIISGVAYFHGDIDGKTLDSGTLFVLQELDESKKTAKGQRTVEKKCETSEVIKQIMHLEFPLKCHVVYEERVTKASEKLIVISCRPIEMAQKKAA